VKPLRSAGYKNQYPARHPALLRTTLFMVLGLCLVLLQYQGSLLTSSQASAAELVEYLWGTTQECHFPIVGEDYSLDGASSGFDDLTADCSGAFTQGKTEKYWIYSDFIPTTLDGFSGVELTVRFNFTGWIDDRFSLQLSVDDGITWMDLEEFAPDNPPPLTIASRVYDLSAYITAIEQLDAVQFRILGLEKVGSADVVTISMDNAGLFVSNQEDEVRPTSSPTLIGQPAGSGPEVEQTGPPNSSSEDSQELQQTRKPTSTSPSGGGPHTPIPTLNFSPTPTPTQDSEQPPTQQPGNDPTVTATSVEQPTASPTLDMEITDTATATSEPAETELPNQSATPTPQPITVTPTLWIDPSATATGIEIATHTPSPTLTQTPVLTSPPEETLPPEYPRDPAESTGLSPHGYFTALTDSCAGCHRSHTSAGSYLLSSSLEEETCYTCHSSLGIAETDVQAAFSTEQNASGAYYNHPVDFTSGVHESSELETSSEDFSGDYRHVECVDCHDPHNANNLETDPPQLQTQVNGASGVEPQYSGPGAPLDFDWLDSAEFEYQLCFKCHSSFVTLPTYIPAGWNGDEVIIGGLAKLTNSESQQVPDNRDMAIEFNPANASFHPVMALGRNLNIPTDSFEEGWSAGSRVYCSDCHNNPAAEEQGSGPHGSSLHIFNERSSYVTVNSGTRMEYTGQEVCFSCHRYQTYVDSSSPDQNTNFRRSNRNLHQTHSEDASCYFCHDSHGSEQLHLINLDASINDVQVDALVFYTGYDGQPTNSQTFWQISPDGGEKTCFISCHQHRHTSPGHSYTNYSLDPP